MTDSASRSPIDPGNIALVFPGQGSQIPGMGRSLAGSHPAAAEIFRRADDTLGRSVSALCFEGGEEELRRTSNTQPALYVTGAAMLAALRSEGVDGAFTAGHSLGEYTALHAAGAFDFETGLRLVEIRGRAMEAAGASRAGTPSEGAMAALLGIEDDQAAEICRAASEAGIVVPANLNTPGQIVISGEKAGVDRAIGLAKEAGCRKAMPLNVGGAFHSPLMEPAAGELREALAKAEISPPRLKFAANVSGSLMSDPEEIRKSLGDQIISCVRWSYCVRAMAESGAARYIEVGPGRVLSGMLKRIDKSLSGWNFEDAESLARLREGISSPAAGG